MLIEIHMIQNHSPSNLNRDDLGAPKTCLFGGVTRARISSQCIKRSIRNPGNSEDVHNRGAGLFFEAMRDHIAQRTKFFPHLVREALGSSEIPDADRAKVVHACSEIAKKEQTETGETAEEVDLDDRPRLPQLVFLERSEAQEFVKRLEAMRKDGEWGKSYIKWIAGNLQKKALAQFLWELSRAYKRRSVDIALFGRMTTSDAFQDVEAAMQVAHAISTHAVMNEVDYFTAVDDLATSTGAGHVDEAQFNSACFYKYFSLDWDQLVHNLAGRQPDKGQDLEGHERWEAELKPQAERLAAATLGHFLRAAALTTPTGKQNSFAAHNHPDGILVEVEKNGKTPCSYANAFADPVALDAQRGLVGQSVAQLGQHVHEIADGYGIQAERFWFSPCGRYPLTWVDRDAKAPEAVKAVVTPEDHNLESLDTLVEAVIKAATGAEWSEVKDAGKASPEVT